MTRKAPMLENLGHSEMVSRCQRRWFTFAIDNFWLWRSALKQAFTLHTWTLLTWRFEDARVPHSLSFLSESATPPQLGWITQGRRILNFLHLQYDFMARIHSNHFFAPDLNFLPREFSHLHPALAGVKRHALAIDASERTHDALFPLSVDPLDLFIEN
jgi:hypothetical protein